MTALWVIITLVFVAGFVIGVGAGVVGTVALAVWLVRRLGRLAVRLAAG